MELRRGREEGRTDITCSALPQLGRGQSSLPPHLLLSPSFLFSLPPPSPPARIPSFPACQPPRAAKQLLSCPLPSCPASPFLLHKITETAERGEKNRGGAPSLPTQLSYPTITRRRPARRPCSFIQSDGRGSTPVPMASSLWRLEP